MATLETNYNIGAGSAISSLSNGKVFNDNGDALSMKFTAKESKTVDKIYLGTYGKPTGGLWRIGIQGDNAGEPDGSYINSVTNDFQTAYKTDGSYYVFEFDITNTALTAGTVYHIVVKYESGTVAGSFTLQTVNTPSGEQAYFDKASYDWMGGTAGVLISSNNGSSWTDYTDNYPNFGFLFTDTSSAGQLYSKNTSDEIYGSTRYVFQIIKIDKSYRLEGIKIRLGKVNSPTGNVILEIQDSNGNVLQTETICACADVASYLTPGWKEATFSSPFLTSANTTYKFVIKAASATASNYIFAYAIYGSLGGDALDGKLTWWGVDSYYNHYQNGNEYSNYQYDLRFLLTAVRGNLWAIGNIRSTQAKTSSAKASIKRLGVARTATAKAQIVYIANKTVTAKARLMYPQTKTIQAKASISNTRKTIQAKARITTCDRIITAKAYIYNGERRTLDSKRRIYRGKIQISDREGNKTVDGGIIQTAGLATGAVTMPKISDFAVTGERVQPMFPILDDDENLNTGYSVSGTGWTVFHNVLHYNMLSYTTETPGDYVQFDFTLEEETDISIIAVKDSSGGRVNVILDDVMEIEGLDLFTEDNVTSRAKVCTISSVSVGDHTLKVSLRPDTSDPDGVRRLIFSGVTLGDLISSRGIGSSVHSIIWASDADQYGYKEFNVQNHMIPEGYDVLAVLSATIFTPDPQTAVRETASYCTTSGAISPGNPVTVTVDNADGFWEGMWVYLSKTGDTSEWAYVYEVNSNTELQLGAVDYSHANGTLVRGYINDCPKVMIDREAVIFYDCVPYQTIEFRVQLLTSLREF